MGHSIRIVLMFNIISRKKWTVELEEKGGLPVQSRVSWSGSLQVMLIVIVLW